MREYLLVALVAAATTYLLTGLVRELAVRVKAMAPVRDRDVHAVPIPRLGGLAMLGGVTVAFALATQLPFLGDTAPDQVTRDAWAVLAGGAVICVFGVLDDRFHLDPLSKFAGQVLAAGVVVIQGVQLYWLPLPGAQTFSLGGAQAAMLTTFVIVLSINAVNFVDGLDGLAAGAVGIGAAAFFSYSYLLARVNDQALANTSTLIAASVAGACIGFLPHNFFPARIFMGDTGSMFLGLMLASATISLTVRVAPQSLTEGIGASGASLLPALLPLLLPFAVLFLPFLDFLLAFSRRTWAGVSPFKPDKLHLHHRLLEIGHTQSRVALVMYLWTSIVGFGVVLMGLVGGWLVVAALAAAVLLAVLVTFGPPPWRRRSTPRVTV